VHETLKPLSEIHVGFARQHHQTLIVCKLAC